VESIAPLSLPTECGILEIRGTNLAGAQVCLDAPGISGTDAGSSSVIIDVLENWDEDRLLLRMGPGAGIQSRLLLQNQYGKTCFKFAYEGETRDK
jgi:hypothetical protein